MGQGAGFRVTTHPPRCTSLDGGMVGFESPPSTKPPFSTRRLDPPIFLKLTIESDDIGPFFLICEVYP